jgi:hypothetical protein
MVGQAKRTRIAPHFTIRVESAHFRLAVTGKASRLLTMTYESSLAIFLSLRFHLGDSLDFAADSVRVAHFGRSGGCGLDDR